MSFDDEVIDVASIEQSGTEPDCVISLTQFVTDFGDSLLAAVTRQNPPVYTGVPDARRDAVMDSLKRKPFAAQRNVVQAVTCLLVDADQPAAIINAEMGTGKSMMSIAVAAVLHRCEGYRRFLVLSPPHLVYKWRREILETITDARVTVLNGPDTLRKLLQLRDPDRPVHDGPEFFVLGRVRMRMGFHWRPAYTVRKLRVQRDESKDPSEGKGKLQAFVACPNCGAFVVDPDEVPYEPARFPDDRRLHCNACESPLWTLMRPSSSAQSQRDLLKSSLCQIPTIGPATAEKLMTRFGESQLAGMIEDNVYEFVNLMDEEGELVFSDRQARRMEKAMARMEFSFGQGGYQATEFVKRYLPDGLFDALIIDEGHEYKGDSSAQGQAMAVLAAKVRKVVGLTGTLMGGYADDLFYLLWRMMPARMIEDGYRYVRGSLGASAMTFMRHHGVLKDIYRETEGSAHKTARGKKINVSTTKAPGFGPKGISRYVLPFTAFLKLKDIGEGVLPAYTEHFHEVSMRADQAQAYGSLSSTLRALLRAALRRGDRSLLGVVLNVLLAWPDCAFRDELVRHPRTRIELAHVPALFPPGEAAPKEADVLALCKAQKAKGRRVLAYSVYSGTRDTTARLKALCEADGLRAAVLRASIDTSRREDWIMEQVDRGIDVLITNPELVKTGLDLLDFPTIAFLQTGFNVYTLQQAARRSWRIGQKEPVDVHFFGYRDTSQIACLELMAKKIAISQSTSGDLPETGLDALNQDDDSLEVALAKQLLAA